MNSFALPVTVTDSPVEALESLLTHPGWLLFIAHVQHEWGSTGARYNTELDKALDLLDSHAAASQARQVRAGRRVIEELLAWPAEETQRLKRLEKPERMAMSRRGSL